MKYPVHLSGLIAAAGGKNSILALRMRDAEIWRIWDDLVGGAIALRTTPLRIINKTLTVAVSNGPWAHQLRFLAPDIIRKINEQLCGDIVTSIVFRQSGFKKDEAVARAEEPLKKRELSVAETRFIAEQTASIVDDELRNSFAELMKSSYQARVR